MATGAIVYGDAVNRAHPLNRGLVSWWLPLPGRSSGPRLLDLAGRNHGTLTNGPTWAPGPNVFGAVKLDGTDDHILGTNTFGATGSLSFAVYPDFTGSDSNFRYVFDTSGSRTLFLRGSSSTNCIVYINGTDVADSSQLVSFFTYQAWNHVSCTWNSGTQRFYKNGVLFATRSASLGSSSGSILYFGQRFTSADRWKGSVNHYAEWSGRMLSDSDAAGLYDQWRRGFPDLLNRVRPWSFGVAGGGGGGTAVPVFVHHLRMQGIA